MLAPNTVLQDRYLVIRSIGQGGMGAVYLARDQRLGNTVALKETFFTDVPMRRAFEREARLLAHLRHPALPKVIDHFDEGEGQFLIMEFIAGDDLEVLLAQRSEPFGVPRVLHWADQLLDALEYLHSQETPILHRDIKPSNLKLASREQIILLDFGLAKGEAGQMTSIATSRSVFGFTPNFAPLEQIQGTGTDPRSDLYSLGATLYYLMTGVIPVNALNRATANVSELPDPLVPANQIDSRIAPAIADILSQAVALNPNRRPATAMEMREALLKASRSLSSVEGSESKTVLITSPVSAPALQANAEAIKTIPSPAQTLPDDRSAVPQPISPTVPSTPPPATIPLPQPSTLFETPAQKPSRLPWLIGGVVAVLLVGIAMTFFIINQNSNASNGWQDTESNRQADQAAGVAARVNGKPIMLSEVERTINQQAAGKQAQLTPNELAQARLQVLDNLIQREVLYQRAEREKLLPTEDQVTATINQQKQKSGMTEEEFAGQLKATSLTMESLREEVKRDLAIQALQNNNTSTITVSDREVEDFYNANKHLFVNTRGVRLTMITADPADNSPQGIQNDAKGEGEARAKIDNIYAQLRGGADFANAARAQSEDEKNSSNGGDIGFATEDELKQNGFPKNLIDQLFNVMSVGSFAAPVRFNSPGFTQGRWYIFKLAERRLRNENLTLESPGIRQVVTESLVKQRSEISNTQLLTSATNESRIVNYLAAKKAGA